MVPLEHQDINSTVGEETGIYISLVHIALVQVVVLLDGDGL